MMMKATYWKRSPKMLMKWKKEKTCGYSKQDRRFDSKSKEFKRSYGFLGFKCAEHK
jgi:hypothetical protein